jgi:glycosyltransferase involved in cell wall biosynthesis
VRGSNMSAAELRELLACPVWEDGELSRPDGQPVRGAAAVARLLDAPDFAQRLAHQAWEYAREHLEPEKTTGAYLSVYTLLAERGQ